MVFTGTTAGTITTVVVVVVVVVGDGIVVVGIKGGIVAKTSPDASDLPTRFVASTVK
jgi:hypothetical protein